MDNILESILVLFNLVTQEGWPDIMFLFVDNNDASSGPHKNNQGIINITHNFI